MNNKFDKLIHNVKDIKLSKEEKSTMLQNIMTEVNSAATKENENNTSPNTNHLYYYHNIIKDYFLIKKNKFVPALIAVLIISISAGTSALAEKAVPGNLLYGIKIKVNEPIAGIFSVTKEQKTEWKEKLIERRLVEIHKLALSNNLDELKRINLGIKIQSQIDDFNISVNKLTLEKNQSIQSSNLNIRLQASLKAYGNALENVLNHSNHKNSERIEIKKMITTLGDSEAKVKETNKGLEFNVGVSRQNTNINKKASDVVDYSNASNKQKAALSLLDSTKFSHQRENRHLSTNINNQVNSKLTTVETILREGNNLLTTNDYSNSIDKFQLAINQTNQIKLLMLSNVIKATINSNNGISDENNDIEYEDNSPESEKNKSSDKIQNINLRTKIKL